MIGLETLRLGRRASGSWLWRADSSGPDLHRLRQRRVFPLPDSSASSSPGGAAASKHCACSISPIPVVAVQTSDVSTHPSLGVAAPDLPPGVKRPRLLPVASRSFCSSASARRLRKSERCTRPTVWALRRSSAVEFWGVKREGGEAGREVGREGAMVVREEEEGEGVVVFWSVCRRTFPKVLLFFVRFR